MERDSFTSNFLQREKAAFGEDYNYDSIGASPVLSEENQAASSIDPFAVAENVEKQVNESDGNSAWLSATEKNVYYYFN